MCLFEWLTDLVRLDPAPPCQHLFDWSPDGMPELDLCAVRHVDRLIRRTHHGVTAPHASMCGPVRREGPDESACERTNQRMIEISLAPALERPAFLHQEHRVESFALCWQHRGDVLHRALQLLQLLLVIALHLGGYGLLRLAIGATPVELDVTPFDP